MSWQVQRCRGSPISPSIRRDTKPGIATKLLALCWAVRPTQHPKLLRAGASLVAQRMKVGAPAWWAAFNLEVDISCGHSLSPISSCIPLTWQDVTRLIVMNPSWSEWGPNLEIPRPSTLPRTFRESFPFCCRNQPFWRLTLGCRLMIRWSFFRWSKLPCTPEQYPPTPRIRVACLTTSGMCWWNPLPGIQRWSAPGTPPMRISCTWHWTRWEGYLIQEALGINHD